MRLTRQLIDRDLDQRHLGRAGIKGQLHGPAIGLKPRREGKGDGENFARLRFIELNVHAFGAEDGVREMERFGAGILNGDGLVDNVGERSGFEDNLRWIDVDNGHDIDGGADGQRRHVRGSGFSADLA